MEAIIIKSEELNLPEEIAKKLKGKELEIIETKEGILLKPIIGDPIKEAKGFLKGSKFSLNRYMELKKEEKELER